MLLRRSSAFLQRNLSNIISRNKPNLGASLGAWNSSKTKVSTSPVITFHANRLHSQRTNIINRCYSSASEAEAEAASKLVKFATSMFSPSLGSLVDISEYLVNGCKLEDAPKCPDYVGPLYIAKTPDGRGRGLYASKDVAAGDILIISNAFATSHNDTHSMELFTKISAIVKQSPKALCQYYSLAGYDCHDAMDVPNIKLFDPNMSNINIENVAAPENLEFDEKRIIHIMHVNSFEGELTTQDNKVQTKLSGLWLLPSFINHSCCPNASRLVVGDAMLILASRDIKANEEINISYTDVMSPLKKREDNLGSMGYGFRCQCRRCELERSVQNELKEFSDQYHELYDQASDEVYSAVTSSDRPSADKSPACSKLYGMYENLRRKVSSLENLSKLEKQWVLGSYSSAFLGNWLVRGYASSFKPPKDFVNSDALELVEAMKVTVPGMLRTLSFATLLAAVAEKEEGYFFALAHRIVQLALDECARVYGKQRVDVTMKLMDQSAEIVPFF